MGAVLVIATTAAVGASAGTQRSQRETAWRVVDFSFRYDEAAENAAPCVDSSVDVARENARIDVGKLRNAQPIEYQYAPGLKARPGGPDSRGHSLLAVGETVDRQVSKEVVDCDTGEHRTVRCSDPLRGSLSAYGTGAYALWTTRSRSIVNMTILLMGMDFQRLLTCDDDPGIVIGSSFLEAATHDTYLVRTTVPLRAFTRPTTTITLSRTLPAPADAASRGYPTGTLTVQAKLVLRKVIRNHISCPAKDPLFVCDNR